MGGVTATIAGSATSVRSPIFTVARTGPSEVSSCQPSLFAKVTARTPDAEAEWPAPPITISRPSASVRSSPSGTWTIDPGAKEIHPWSKAYSGPLRSRPQIVFGPGSITRSSRCAPWIVALRYPGVMANCFRSSAFRN